MADPATLLGVVAELGSIATLKTIGGTDHSFHVRKASGSTDAEALAEVLDALAEWIGKVPKHTAAR